MDQIFIKWIIKHGCVNHDGFHDDNTINIIVYSYFVTKEWKSKILLSNKKKENCSRKREKIPVPKKMLSCNPCRNDKQQGKRNKSVNFLP